MKNSVEEIEEMNIQEHAQTSLSRLVGPIKLICVPVSAPTDSVSAQAVPFETILAYWNRTSKKFIWLEDDIGNSAEVIAAAAYIMTVLSATELKPVFYEGLDGYIYKAFVEKTGKELFLPFDGIGCFWINQSVCSEQECFCLYIDDGKAVSPDEGTTTIYQYFQKTYSKVTGHIYGSIAQAAFAAYSDHSPKLFRTLANRSLNRKRKVDLRTRVRILDRDNRTCQVCGRRAPQVELEVDHRIPVIEGGKNTDSNLWAICKDCNRGKAALPLFRNR